MKKNRPIVSAANTYMVKILPTGIGLVSILIVPWFSVDGFNIGKFISLIFLAGMIVPCINLKSLAQQINKSHKRYVFIFATLFPVNLLIVFLVNSANKTQQLYGDFGRRSGLLTNIAYFLIFLFIAQISNGDTRSKLFKTLASLGTFSVFYTFLQPTGLFTIEDLQSKNLTPYGFFGNSNFNSAFIGMASISLIPFLKSRNWRGPLTLLLGFFFVAIIFTESQQGLILFFSGTIVYISIFAIYRFSRIKSIIFLICLGISSLAFFVAGLFNRGIFASFLYQDSVMARNFYWQAGWNITLDNPFFGVGLDRFGDWYWAYRSEDSIRKLGPENFSTSAHNVFLDISSSGGFPLLCTYLIFLIFIFFVALNYILRSKNPDKFFIASFSIWISLQIYSLISIGHIGLMVWNWIFAGLIVAKVTEDGKNFPTRIPFTKTKILFSMIVCFLLVFPLAKESVMSKSAFKENSVSGYVEYLNSNKIEPRNISLALTKLQNSSNDGLDFAREAVKRFPNYYDLWFIIYVNPNSSIDEKRISLSNLLRLNPYNAELLKSKT